MELIYLDHNATSPLLPQVAAAMQPWLGDRFGNPSSQHQFGRRARQAIEEARDGIGQILGARLTGAKPDRVLFTSGGTEANNLALLGLSTTSTPGECEAIVSQLEHPSVAGCAQVLTRRGWTMHQLATHSNGQVDAASLASLVSPRTKFVSVLLASNETGVIQPVAEMAGICASAGVPFHTDAVQMVGRLPVDFQALGVSSLSAAAHKFHGPLGIGVLIARHDLPLEPVLVGGFQQGGLRGGTESPALAVGMFAALDAWRQEAESRVARMRALRDRLEMALLSGYGGSIVVHGSECERLPQTSNVAFLGLDRQALLMGLDLAGVACSTGSACASGSSEPSPVLAAMGCSKQQLDSSLRFSLGATTTSEQVDEAIARILQVAGAMLKQQRAK